MGFFQRLLGAAGRDGNRDRSPDEARSDADTGEDIRALIREIRLLRETIGGVLEAPQPAGRSRRGGKGHGRPAVATEEIAEREPERERDRERERERERERDRDRQPTRRGLPKEPPEDAPTGPLVDYLRSREVTVYEGQDDLARNEAFEHLARHIGTHFDLVGPFYEKMKRAVASGHGQRIDLDRWSEGERSAAVQLGTMLHRHGLLKDFYYHRSPKRQLRVIPTKDGSTAQFLTGGWLEIYVSWLLTRRLRARMSPAKFQILFNVKGTLPTKREFEADLMATVDGRMLWVECKTGNWQDYAARFRGLVKVFGCDRESAALLLIRPPDASTRSRATDMLDMTLISLDEVDGFMNRFLGISESEAAAERASRLLEDAADRTAPLPLGRFEPPSDDEIPLEDAEPARVLGHVAIEGSEADAAAGAGRRRRRGRRGGRGRRRAAEGAPATRLLEPVPILPLDGDEEEDLELAPEAEQVEVDSASPAEAIAAVPETAPSPEDSPHEAAATSPSRPARTRERRRRPSPFATASAGSGDGSGEASEESPAASAIDEAESALAEASATLSALAAAVETSAVPGAGDGEEDATSAEAQVRRRRRRRRSHRPEEGKPEGSEASEAIAAGGPVDPPEPEPEPQPEPAAPAPPVAAGRPVAPVPPVAPAKTSPRGVTIAPDLAAMIARPVPPPKVD